MKIGLCVPMNELWQSAALRLKEAFPETTFVEGVDACLADFATLDAVAANAIDNRYYENAKNLKAVFVPFVGINHLPVETLKRRGIAVYNCHGNAFSVAERALALTLVGFGRIIEYHNDLKQDHWHGFWVGKGREDYWDSIEGKRCAVLGTGAIGQKLAEFLKVFSCSVTGFKRTTPDKALPSFDVVTTDLTEAISGKDIVFITLPLTSQTKDLIGQRELQAMRGAWLTNVGRGEIVSEEALYTALLDKILRGAALDVWYTYPENKSEYGAPSRFPLTSLDNVVLSPHVAGSTWQAVIHNVEQTRDNIMSYLGTGSGLYRVELSELY